MRRRGTAARAAGPVNEQVTPLAGHAELLAKVRRLEVELERYREHAQRTSKLFLSATNYADWVRESARRDAQVALRKARAKVQKLERAARELERTEDELVRLKDELARLQALTDETRERVSAFLEAGLQVLSTRRVVEDDNPSPALGDLQNTLQERLASTSVPAPTEQAEVEDRRYSGRSRPPTTT